MRALLVLTVVLLLAGRSEATVVHFGFTGLVTVSSDNPYGQAIPVGSPVSGGFAYETSSVVTHALPNGVGYRQQMSNGFFATIGGVTIRADEYVVGVSDNLVSGSNVSDAISISFDSQLNPPLGQPLKVANVNRTAGLFSLNLSGLSSAFSGTALPPTISSAAFPTKLGFFSDMSSPLIDVFFVATTLTMVPEPSTATSLSAAIPLAIVLLRWVNRGRRQSPCKAVRLRR